MCMKFVCFLLKLFVLLFRHWSIFRRHSRDAGFRSGTLVEILLVSGSPLLHHGTRTISYTFWEFYKLKKIYYKYRLVFLCYSNSFTVADDNNVGSHQLRTAQLWRLQVPNVGKHIGNGNCGLFRSLHSNGCALEAPHYTWDVSTGKMTT